MNIVKVCWREDLLRSRNLDKREIEGYGFFIGWFDSWRVGKELKLGRNSAERFWREVVKSKEREQWQIDQWTEAMSWFLEWGAICKRKGSDYKSLAISL